MRQLHFMMMEERKKQMNHRYPLEELEERIGYRFQNRPLLQQALTHSSYANERKINKTEDYERLEFLGDAVLEVTVSDYLFHTYPEMKEGEMTKMRASLVCGPTLAFCASEIHLGDFLLLGKGEEMTNGRNKENIIADVFEAIIGAMYLDGGFTNAKEFIHRFVLNDLAHKALFYDSKTILQEKVQEKGKVLSYRVVAESGPDHDKMFEVEALVDGKPVSRGCDRTKKGAEQKAAYEILLRMKNGGDSDLCI